MARKRILSIDGGGIKGIIPLCMLVELEKQLGKPAREVFSMMAGTSTGAIIVGGLATGLSAQDGLNLYMTMGSVAFQSDVLGSILSGGSFRYHTRPLYNLIKKTIGNPTLNDVQTDLLVSAVRVEDGMPFYFMKDNAVNGARFGNLRLPDCIAASAAAPTFFEPWKIPGIGACVDGGVGIAGNPSYVACVNAFENMPSDAYPIANSTCISLGTGFYQGKSNPTNIIAWVQWVFGELISEPAEQQTALLYRHYKPQGLHVQRLNVQMPIDVGLDDLSATHLLLEIGQAAAAQLDWEKLLTAADGTKALDEPMTLLNAPVPRTVIVVPAKHPTKHETKSISETD